MTTTLVRRNDAPWLTAGRGLIHNERPGGGRSTYSSGAGNLVQAQPYPGDD